MYNNFINTINDHSLNNISLHDLYENAVTLKNKEVLSNSDFLKVESSILDIVKTIENALSKEYLVREAKLSDVEALYQMVCYWAKVGENLPRPKTDLIRNIQTFAVVTKGDVVIGCACLYVYDSGLAEIRSLGISPSYQGLGLGREIVNFLLKKAHKMEIEKVFVLTRNKAFFSKVGFDLTHISKLPEKILKDCDNCSKKESCDEVAMIFAVNK